MIPSIAALEGKGHEEVAAYAVAASLEVGVPQEFVLRLHEYVNNGVPPGGFMFAVLANDLRGALARADHRNSTGIHSIVSFVYWYVPANAVGSIEAVEKWLAEKEEERDAGEDSATHPEVPAL